MCWDNSRIGARCIRLWELRTDKQLNATHLKSVGHIIIIILVVDLAILQFYNSMYDFNFSAELIKNIFRVIFNRLTFVCEHTRSADTTVRTTVRRKQNTFYRVYLFC